MRYLIEHEFHAAKPLSHTEQILCTLDIGGSASTVIMGRAIAEVLSEIRDELTISPDHQQVTLTALLESCGGHFRQADLSVLIR